MRASRLLNLLLLLQTRQRMTTAELAQRLEVSRRTVLRDVEALSTVGVPVYTERGRRGGVVLLPTARLNVSYLEPPELEALAITGSDSEHLHRLGLTAAHSNAARKLAVRRTAAPSGSPTSSGTSLADVVLVDSSRWLAEPGAEVDIADLASTLRHRSQLRIRYRRSGQQRGSTRVVDPYGLVAKSGRWYLVADDHGAGRLFALERLSSYTTLDAQAALRPGQSLRTVWETLKEHTESLGQVDVTARLRASRVDLARRVLGARLHQVGNPTRGWCTVTIRYPDTESVRQLLQFGDHIEVLTPQAARQRVHDLAADLADRHSP